MRFRFFPTAVSVLLWLLCGSSAFGEQADEEPGEAANATAEEAPAGAEETGTPEGQAPIRLDLRYGLKETLFPETFDDEGQVIEARRGKRLVLVPAVYDVAGGAFSLSSRNCSFYQDEKRKAKVRGIVLMENRGAKDSAVDLTITKGDPLWETVKLEEPEKPKKERPAAQVPAAPVPTKAIELDCQNTSSPTPAPTAAGGGRAGPKATDRIRKARRPTSGYLAFVVEVPAEQQTLEFQFGKGPRILLQLDWMAQANQPLDKLNDQEAEPVLAGLTALIEKGSPPMVGLSVAKLAAWRKEQSNMSPALAKRIDQAMLFALGRQEPEIREAAWDVLINGDIDLTKPESARLFSGASPEVLEGIVLQAAQTLARTKGNAEGDQQAGSGGGQRRTIADTGLPPGGLPDSAADANAFAALLGVCKSGDAALVQRAVDVLLEDGTRQSVWVFSFPTEAQAIAGKRLKDVKDKALAAAVFATLLKNAQAKDLATLAQAAASVSILIDSSKHPVLELANRARDDTAKAALVAMLSKAEIPAAVLESNEMLGVLRMLTDKDVDGKVQQKAIGMILEKWQPQDRIIVEPSEVESKSAAFATFVAEQAGKEIEGVALMASRAMLAVGQIDALSAGLRKGSRDVKKQVVERISQDPVLGRNHTTARFLAAMTEDTDIGAETVVHLESVLNSLGLRRWIGHQAVKRQMPWMRLNELVGESEAGQAAMKVLRSLATVNDDKRGEIEIQRDINARRQLIQGLDTEQKDKPKGSFGCVVYADVLLPVEPLESGPEGSAEPAQSDGATELKQWWRLLRNQWFSVDGITIPTAEANKPQEVRFRGTKKLTLSEEEKKAATPGMLRINVGPLLQAALESKDVGDPSLSEKLRAADVPGDVVAEFKYVQLGTWTAELTFQHGGDRGVQEGSRVNLGAVGGRPKPYLSKVILVLEPKP